jgi:hypothetical protein
MDCDAGDSLCGNVLSGVILGPALNKGLVPLTIDIWQNP